MDLRDRISSISAVDDGGYVSGVVNEAVRSELADLPPSALEPECSVSQTDGTLEVSGKYVVSVFAGGGRAHEVRPHEADDSSMSGRVRRLKRDGRAVYWTESSTLHVDLPPRVQHADVYHLPAPPFKPNERPYNPQIRDVIAARASLLLLEEQAAMARAGLTLLERLPSPPEAPPAPKIEYSDASAVAPTATSINPLPSAPSFNNQSPSKPNQVSVDSLDLSTEIDDATTLDPPSQTLDFSVTESLPTYNGPTDLSLSYTDYETYFDAEDPEMSTEALEKLQTEVQEYQADVEQALSDFRNQIQSYSAEVQKESESAGVDAQDFQTDLQGYQSQVERQVQEHARNVQATIEEYTATGNVEQAFQQLAIQQEQARVQTELSSYEQEVQKTLQQAQIAAQEARQTAEQETQVDLQNKARQLEADLEDFRVDLQAYEQELQAYRAEIETRLQEVQVDTETRQRKQQMIQKDQQRIQQRYQRARRSLLNRTPPTQISPDGSMM